MANKKIVLEVELDAGLASKSLGGLEKGINKAKEELAGLEIGSQKFKELAREISTAEARVKDFELRFEALDFEQRLTAGIDVATGIAGGFAAAEGAAALFGEQSEALEKTLVKVSAAFTLVSGLREIGNGIAAFRKLGAAAKAYGVIQKAVNVIMSLNPIGLIVLAIGSLIAGIIALGSKFGWLGKIVDAISAPFIFLVDTIKSFIRFMSPAIAAMEDAAKAQEELKAKTEQLIEATKKQAEEQEKLIKSTKRREDAESKARDHEIRLAKAAGKITIKLEREKLEASVRRIDRQLKDEVKLFVLRKSQLIQEIKLEQLKGTLSKEREAELVKFVQEELTARAKSLTDLTQGLDAAKKDLEVFNVETETARRKASKNRSKQTKSDNDKQAKADLDAAKKLAAMEEKARQSRIDAKIAEGERLLEVDNILEDARITALTDEFAREKEVRLIEFDDRIAELNEQGLLTADVTKSLEAQLATDLSEIKDRARKAEEDAEKVAADKADARRQEQLDNVQSGLDFLNAANDAFVKDEAKREKIRKALAIAQIAIDTARAISSAIAAGAGIPFPGNIPAILSGVTAVFAGIAQAKAILGESGTTDVGAIGQAAAGANGGGINAPVNTFQTGTDRDREQISQRVVVVESDITATQNTVAGVEEQATF